jgi:hypothetical protein
MGGTRLRRGRAGRRAERRRWGFGHARWRRGGRRLVRLVRGRCRAAGRCRRAPRRDRGRTQVPRTRAPARRGEGHGNSSSGGEGQHPCGHSEYGLATAPKVGATGTWQDLASAPVFLRHSRFAGGVDDGSALSRARVLEGRDRLPVRRLADGSPAPAPTEMLAHPGRWRFELRTAAPAVRHRLVGAAPLKSGAAARTLEVLQQAMAPTNAALRSHSLRSAQLRTARMSENYRWSAWVRGLRSAYWNRRPLRKEGAYD